MLGNLKKAEIKVGLIFTYKQLGSDTVDIGQCNAIYYRTKALAKYEILSAKELKPYEFEVTAKIISLY